MTNEELRACMVMLADRWNNTILPGTIAEWAEELRPMNADDVRAGIRSLSRASRFPSLADLVEHVGAAREERRRLEAAEAKQLGDGRRPLTDDERRLNMVRVRVVLDVALKRLPAETDTLAEARRRMQAKEETT